MSDKTYFPRLFEPITIGKVKLKNRLVMLPMGTAFATSTGEVTEQTIDHYVTRAKGGIGYIIVGNVSPYLPASAHSVTLDTDYHLMGHYALVEKVHAAGAKIAPQLNYPGRQKSKSIFYPGEVPVSSSALNTVYIGNVFPTARPLSKDEIYEYINKYVQAAVRAKMVGYDMVEIHGGHGYLVTQFMSPFMNKRTDEFGGSLENRMRFAVELIKTMRKAVGQDFPIGIRFSADEYVPGGVTMKEAPRMAQILEAAGVDYISPSVGVFESADRNMGLMSYEEGWREYIWEGVKKAVKVPILGGGDIKHPDYAQKVLERGNADFIGLARCVLADPEWPIKAREGRVEDIRYCISCLECMPFGSGARRRGGGNRRCAINAASGREKDFNVLIQAPKPKQVMIIGGGPAGMEAARIAAMRGHHVTVYDKGKELGGQLLIASRPKAKKKISWLVEYLTTQLSKLGVRVELGVEVTPKMVAESKPDAVVVATGALPITLNLPGAKGKNVKGAWELLLSNRKPKDKNVAIIGGGIIGCEVAEDLMEYGNKLTIIEMLPAIAADMEPHHRYTLVNKTFKEHDVTLLTNRKVSSITEKGVQMTNSETGKEELVEADLVIMAVGSKSVNALVEELEGKVPELYVAGDCNRPRVIMEAVYEGSLAGRQI